MEENQIIEVKNCWEKIKLKMWRISMQNVFSPTRELSNYWEMQLAILTLTDTYHTT